MIEDLNSKTYLIFLVLRLHHDSDLVRWYGLHFEGFPFKVLKMTFSGFCSLLDEWEMLGASLSPDIEICDVFITRLARGFFYSFGHSIEIFASIFKETQ